MPGLALIWLEPTRLAKGLFNNSMGLMYDPNRKLVWAVGQNSHVHALRLDLKSAVMQTLR